MEERVMAQEPTPAAIPAAEAGQAVHGHEVAAGSTEVAAHGDKGGLPQFEFQHWGGQILWLLILFAIFYLLVAKVFTPRMRKVLDARSETISGAIAEARRAQAEAEEQATQAQAEIADARGQAQRIAAEARAKSKAEADARTAKEEAELTGLLGQAETRIRAARDEAMSHVGEIAADTAQAIVAKLTTAATANELANARALA